MWCQQFHMNELLMHYCLARGRRHGDCSRAKASQISSSGFLVSRTARNIITHHARTLVPRIANKVAKRSLFSLHFSGKKLNLFVVPLYECVAARNRIVVRLQSAQILRRVKENSLFPSLWRISEGTVNSLQSIHNCSLSSSPEFHSFVWESRRFFRHHGRSLEAGFYDATKIVS